jgi:hypothetical protein
LDHSGFFPVSMATRSFAPSLNAFHPFLRLHKFSSNDPEPFIPRDWSIVG